MSELEVPDALGIGDEPDGVPDELPEDMPVVPDVPDVPEDEPGMAPGACVLVSGDDVEPDEPCADGVAEEPAGPVVPVDPDVWA